MIPDPNKFPRGDQRIRCDRDGIAKLTALRDSLSTPQSRRIATNRARRIAKLPPR